MAVRWNIKAKFELADIAEFWEGVADEAVSKSITDTIKRDIRRFALMPFLGRKDLDVALEFQEQYQFWLIYRSQYRVYFKRLGPRTIQVLRIWPARKPPLEPGDILN